MMMMMMIIIIIIIIIIIVIIHCNHYVYSLAKGLQLTLGTSATYR